MILELSLMAVSAAVMIFLLAYKQKEISLGGRGALADIREKADPLLRDIHQTTGQVLSRFTLRNAVLVANHVFVGIVRLFMNISHKVHTSSAAIVEKASQKKEDLSRSGAASFYLKQIKESKDESPKTGTEEEKM